MPIPSSIADLSTTAASNSPLGNEPPTEGDNHIRALAAILKQVYEANSASGGSALVGFLPAGTGATARTAQAKMRETISVRDFGAVLDGSTNDAAAVQAAFTAANGTGLTVVFDGPSCKISSSISQDNHAHYTVDWGGCQVSYLGGSGTYMLDMTQAGRIVHMGGVFTGNTNNHMVKTVGSASAQATTYPTVPNEDQYSRQLEFYPRVVTGFATVFDLQNFSREIWIRGYLTQNTTSIKTTGKVVNLHVTDSVLYSTVASSQSVLVRGDSGDTAFRYAEGLFFDNCIADVQGVAVDIRDAFCVKWNGGQIKSPSGTVGLDITKGVTALTRDLFFSDTLIEAAVRTGNGLASTFQMQVKLSNCTFTGIANTAIVVSQYSVGVTVNGASFDAGTGTPRMFSVAADCANIKFDGLVQDTSTYTNAPTISSNSVAGTEAEFSGSFTPAIAFGGGTTGITYGTQSGRYYYRGGMISGFYQITLTSKGSSTGVATITGLPFACGLLNGAAGVTKYASMNTAFTPILDITINTSVINVKTGAAGSEATFGNADFSDTSVINGWFSYPVA
jgi:hypothetical protein